LSLDARVYNGWMNNEMFEDAIIKEERTSLEKESKDGLVRSENMLEMDNRLIKTRNVRSWQISW